MIQKDKPIALIHTPCKECIFAVYNGDTQIDCKFDYIAKYRNLGLDILEVYDNEKNFYVINNKKCLCYRTKNWLEKNKDRDINNLIIEENMIKYIAVIKLNTDDTLDDLRRTLDEIRTQYIRPLGIILYKNRLDNHSLNNASILELMSSVDDIKWRIQNFIDSDMTDTDRLKATIASCPINRFYLLVEDIKVSIDKNCTRSIQKYIDSGHSFGCININNHKFFSYIAVQYAKNIKHIDLLSEPSLQINYETIS